MTANEKYCGGCRVVKPKTEFNRNPRTHDRLQNKCRTCTKAYAAWYRSKYPKTPEQLEAHRAYNQTYRPANKEAINARRRAVRAEAKRIELIRNKFAQTREVAHEMVEN